MTAYNLSTPTCQKCFKSAPCKNCGAIRVAHTAKYQTCPDPDGGYLSTVYMPVDQWLEFHRCEPRTEILSI